MQLDTLQENSFQNLFNTYKNKVFNIVLNMVHNHEDAEEITQEVFIEVFHSQANFKGQSDVFTWIYRVAVNKSLDFLKAKKRKK